MHFQGTPVKLWLRLNPQGTCHAHQAVSLKSSYSQFRPPFLGTHSVAMARTLNTFHSSTTACYQSWSYPAISPQPSHRDPGIPRKLALTSMSPWANGHSQPPPIPASESELRRDPPCSGKKGDEMAGTGCTTACTGLRWTGWMKRIDNGGAQSWSLMPDRRLMWTLGGRSNVPLLPVVSQLALATEGRDSFQALWELTLDQHERLSPGLEAYVFQQKAFSLRDSQQNREAICWSPGAKGQKGTTQFLSKSLQAADTQSRQRPV